MPRLSRTRLAKWEHSIAIYLQGACMALKSKWSILTDALYLNVLASKTLALLPPIGGPAINVTTDARLFVGSRNV